ncbi:branched-chain amino acid ABC transporter permease [Thiomonas sp. FB-Cd]|uniref:branched-chain amino acid ABC transporter permease n=1 Tax=Thiomonas sp. FB-Cd TaxID=1158292 RepID=UPI00068EF4DC|nr:branched-chain amino acid ABC transporter permease [Thiomonas sp. FB-Cd]
MLGLVNGAFYAMLSLGLAVIFGLMDVVNFAHGAFFMMGAMFTWIGRQYFDLGFWWMLFIAPLLVGLIGVGVERLMLRRLRGMDPIYGLLLTFGLTLLIEGIFRSFFGVAGAPYNPPEVLGSTLNLGFMFLPSYLAFAVVASVVVCFGTWLLIERTKLGSYLRAGTENPALVQAFGINFPLLVTSTFAFGSALAGLAGVLAAPVIQVSPLMGSNLIIVVFAIVVIGGMGSVVGAIVSGLALGLIEGLAKVLYAPISTTVVFILMALVLTARPAGLFGRDR